ncbi:hypothetical protein D3C78_1567340 [compost metagenome]
MRMVLHVAYVGAQLFRDHLFMQANQLIADFVHRHRGIAQCQQVTAQGIDVLNGGLIKLRFKHVGFDAFDGLLELRHHGTVVIHHKVQHRIQGKTRPTAHLPVIFLGFGADRRIAG